MRFLKCSILVATLTLSACSASPAPSAGTPITTTSKSASAVGQKAANGVQDLAPEAIYKAVVAALRKQTTMQVAASGIIDGKAWKSLTQYEATTGAHVTEDGTTDGHREIIYTKSTTFRHASRAFWTSWAKGNAKAVALIGDKWMSSATTAADATAGSLESLLTDPMLARLTPTKGPLRIIGGVETVGLVFGSDKTFWISTTGEPLPLRIDAQGDLEIVTFAIPVTIVAPPASNTVSETKVRAAH